MWAMSLVMGVRKVMPTPLTSSCFHAGAGCDDGGGVVAQNFMRREAVFVRLGGENKDDCNQRDSCRNRAVPIFACGLRSLAPDEVHA